MTDHRSAPDVGGPSGDGSPSGTPRWVKVVGFVVLVAGLLLVALLLVGGGHGPARHASAGCPAVGISSAVSSSV